MQIHPARQGMVEIQALNLSIRSCRQKSSAHVRIRLAVDRNLESGIHNGTTRPERTFLNGNAKKNLLFVVPVKV